MVETTVRFAGGMRFEAESGSGHKVTMDASPESGGKNSGIRPMEMMLSAVGGCTGMDVVPILLKKRQDITGYEVRVSGKRADGYPQVFTEISVEHVVRGRNVDPKAVERAVELSTEKYCSAIGTIRGVAKVTTSYRIVEEEGPDAKASGKLTTKTA
jgi:putative redox protein